MLVRVCTLMIYRSIALAMMCGRIGGGSVSGKTVSRCLSGFDILATRFDPSQFRRIARPMRTLPVPGDERDAGSH